LNLKFNCELNVLICDSKLGILRSIEKFNSLRCQKTSMNCRGSVMKCFITDVTQAKVQSTIIFVEYERISPKGTEYRNIKGVNISVLCTFGTTFYENSTNISVLCTFA
jgi:hypothetical protein